MKLAVKVGSSGTRLGMTEAQRIAFTHQLHALGATELHHGDCQGADEQAHQIARALGVAVVGHPPTASGLRAFCECDQLRRPRPFLTRNHEIVTECSVLIVTPEGPPRLRSGTWSTVRHARKVGVPVIVIDPYGHVESDLGQLSA